MALASEVTTRLLGDLHPDPLNPRLPPERRPFTDEDALLVFLADAFDAITIAESIARHGYYASEPLVICEEDGRWLVLEGNRRLSALMLLVRRDLAEHTHRPTAWLALEPVQTWSLETSVPVLVADQRTDVDALIGFRHIGGVLDWKPLQRAQFIAYLVDDRRLPFVEVSETVGEEDKTVRMLYRNERILDATRVMDRPELAAQGQARFGTYTAALNRNGLRDFIGARPVAEVRERRPQLQEQDLPELVELFSWLYGDAEHDKVIAETRELTLLAEVVREPNALIELRRSRDLTSAYAHTPGPPKRLLQQLAVAVGHLRSVVASAGTIAQSERAQELAAELRELIGQLNDALDSAPGALED
jgi:hypothetical protein